MENINEIKKVTKRKIKQTQEPKNQIKNKISSHFERIKPIDFNSFTDSVFEASFYRREKLKEILNRLNQFIV